MQKGKYYSKMECVLIPEQMSQGSVTTITLVEEMLLPALR
jgi:hypothetical protein